MKVLDPLQEAPEWELETPDEDEENIPVSENEEDPEVIVNDDKNTNPWEKPGQKKRKKISPIKINNRRHRDPEKISQFIKEYLLGTATKSDCLTRDFTSELDEMLNDHVGDSLLAMAASH